MFEYLKRLRKEPEEKRRTVALRISIVVTSVMVMVWIADLAVSSGTDRSVADTAWSKKDAAVSDDRSFAEEAAAAFRSILSSLEIGGTLSENATTSSDL